MSDLVPAPRNDTERGEASLALIRSDPSFNALPVPFQNAISNIFLPPPKLVGDFTGSERRWMPQYLKLEQKGGRNSDGSHKLVGAVYGKKQLPDPYRCIVLGYWHSRELFASPDSDEKGLLCASVNGSVPALRIENPRAKDCWKCTHNSTYNKRAGNKDFTPIVLKCRATQNFALLIIEPDPQIIGVSILQLYGVSYRTGSAIISEMEGKGSTTGSIFTMGTVEESPRPGLRYYKHVIQKIEPTPPEMGVLLREIQARTASWVNAHQLEERYRSAPAETEETAAPVSDMSDPGSAVESDDTPLT